MRIRPILFGLAVVAIFLAPVIVAQATGTWATTGRPGAGEGIGPGSGGAGAQGEGVGEQGEGAGRGGAGQGAGSGQGRGGEIAPGEARGWMTLAQIAEANGLEVAEILDAFGLPPSTDPATELRDLESPAFSVPALRDWLAERASP